MTGMQSSVDANSVALVVHIMAGSLALPTGFAAMIVPKGGRWHMLFGRVYVWSMVSVAMTAFWLSAATGNVFLGGIAGFSLYLVMSGYRAPARKLPMTPVSWVDVAIPVVGVASGGSLLALATTRGFAATTLVAAVLGSIAILLSCADGRRLQRPPAEKMRWWFNHMTRMLAAHIATVTAVSVVNFEFLPEVSRWLWPTVVGSVGITVWVRYYVRRFAQQRHRSATA